ncbi:Fms-interacting protein-domain-containing protein [Lipomyces japonicus]|uniref:Fms-interacting protein-domain-containing protein n=1 Tax=Lipomyces japonicus TaxID=56871 RepID=UPI0034CF42BA
MLLPVNTDDPTLKEAREIVESLRRASERAHHYLGLLVDSLSQSSNEKNNHNQSLLGGSEAQLKFAAAYQDLQLLIVKLRQVNRTSSVDARVSREKIIQKRTESDRLELDLQNVQYRQRFLLQEIALCNDFSSEHENIDFVPIETFTQDHSDFAKKDVEEDTEMMDESKNDNTNDDHDHRLTLARLKDERQRRLDLETRKKELITAKAKLVAENKKRTSDLESLDQQLQKFIESATPIQGFLDRH